MRKNRFLPVILILLLISGCCPLVSQSPLSDPSKAYFDERLSGTWKLQGENKETVYLHIGKMENNHARIVSIEHKSSGRLDLMEFVMFPTKIAGHDYMNVSFVKPYNDIEENKPAYYIARYDFRDDNSFSLSFLDKDMISRAIRTGQLKGETEMRSIPLGKGKKTEIECVEMTESSHKLVEFLKKKDPEKIFSQSELLVFRKKN
ncbi:MAG: hypothetical protein OEV42_18625 [Deltaproteobacteria bacterium]|nr:hypothetical protein [Deltaproteobacteria bacterium]